MKTSRRASQVGAAKYSERTVDTVDAVDVQWTFVSNGGAKNQLAVIDERAEQTFGTGQRSHIKVRLSYDFDS